MVLVHVCFIYNTAIFFTLTKSAKNQGQKLEHWQNHNNSNGKLALVPFPCSRTMTMIFNMFSTSRFNKSGNLLYCHISPFILCDLRREFPKYFQHTQKYICFTGQSVLVNGKLTPEGGNRVKFSKSICFELGARETRLSDNMTLGWKTERSARTNTKMLSTKQATDRSIDCLQAVGPLNVNISTNVIRPLKC